MQVKMGHILYINILSVLFETNKSFSKKPAAL